MGDLCPWGWCWCWWEWEWCLDASVRNVTVLFSLEVVLKSTLVLPLNRESLWWGSRHSLQAPALRLYWYSPAPGQSTGLEQVLISVKLGQFAPPYIGVARTCRVRCCRPAPQVLLQLDQKVKSETTQSWGQGMRHACSMGGFWEKNSHIREETVVRFELRKQWTLRLWMPCCAVMHSADLGFTSLAKKETRTQLPQSDTSHLKRSWCQLQTLKQCRWLSGLSMCWQWVWWVVQPSMWTHHIVLVWTPPEPHSSPIQWPHWPATKTRNTQRTFLFNLGALETKHNDLNCSSLHSSKFYGHSQNPHDCFIHEVRKTGTQSHQTFSRH